MTSQEALTSLRAMLETGIYYARQSQMGKNSDPAHDESTARFLQRFNSLGFANASELGYQVSQGTTSWKAWGAAFQSAVEDLIAYRKEYGYDGHEVSGQGGIINGYGVTFSGSGLYIGQRTDDPLQSWWLDFAAPSLDSMAVTDAVDWITTPLQEGAAAVEGVLDYATPVVVVVIVVLVLILAINLTG